MNMFYKQKTLEILYLVIAKYNLSWFLLKVLFYYLAFLSLMSYLALLNTYTQISYTGVFAVSPDAELQNPEPLLLRYSGSGSWVPLSQHFVNWLMHNCFLWESDWWSLLSQSKRKGGEWNIKWEWKDFLSQMTETIWTKLSYQKLKIEKYYK